MGILLRCSMRLRNPEKVHLINFSTYYCKLLLRRMETWSRYSIGLFLINGERISKISSKRGKILARVYTRYDRRMGFSWREPFVRRHFPLESKPRSPPCPRFECSTAAAESRVIPSNQPETNPFHREYRDTTEFFRRPRR